MTNFRPVFLSAGIQPRGPGRRKNRDTIGGNYANTLMVKWAAGARWDVNYLYAQKRPWRIPQIHA
jgi:hypothetical protein